MATGTTPYRLTDALDALSNSAGVLALIDDLLACANDGDVTLSGKGAMGLGQLLRQCRSDMEAAVEVAYADLQSNFGSERQSLCDFASKEYRRGYGEGIKAAQARHTAPMPAAEPPTSREDREGRQPGGKGADPSAPRLTELIAEETETGLRRPA